MTTVLYIAGTSYCGSTLLSFLLNAHPEIVSVGEETGPDIDTDPNQFECSCHRELAACPFWKKMADAMKARGCEFRPAYWHTAFKLGASPLMRQLLVRSLRSNAADGLRDALVRALPGWGSRLRELEQRNRAFVESACEVSGKRVFAAAAKDPTRVRFLQRVAGLDVRVIHLVRDACGYVASAMKNQGVSLGLAIRHWNRNAGHVERLGGIVPAANMLRLRYEDLCTDVVGSMRRLAEFGGVKPMDRIPSFHDTDHHVIGNRMRLIDSSEITLDESWKKKLTPDQKKEVLARTARFRRRFGYPMQVD